MYLLDNEDWVSITNVNMMQPPYLGFTHLIYIVTHSLRVAK